MDLQDLAAYLRNLKKVAATAASPAANAMAQGVQGRIQAVLRETSHPPYTFWKATMGRPPAYATGNLARSIIFTPAYGGVRATAGVGATMRYAAIQEWGGWTMPNNSRYMHWRNPRPWWKQRVTIPEHPYFRPTVEAMIRDGSLSQLAKDAFFDRIAPALYRS
jgi:phage gpG-like protein